MSLNAAADDDEFDDDRADLVESMNVTSNSSENGAVVAGGSPPYTPSRVRWYVLFVFSALTFMQGYVWNVFGPIYASMRQLFGWDQRQLALMPLYGVAPMGLLAIPAAYVLTRFRLRTTVVAMAALTLLSSALKCVDVADDSTVSNLLLNLSALANGLASVPTMLVPPLLSALWFADDERKLATAVGELANAAGIAATYLVGPLAVPEPAAGVSSAVMRTHYRLYVYAITGVAGAVFAAVLVHFPSKPARPPSATAEVPRAAFGDGCRRLLTSAQFWLICMAFCLTNGSFIGFFPMLQVDMQTHGIDQDHVGQLGFWTAVVGIALGVVMGALSDYAGGQGALKASMLALSVLASLGAGWWLAMAEGVLPLTLREVWLAMVIFGGAAVAITPVAFQLAAEAMLPVDEGVTCGFLTVIGCGWSSCFYLTAMVLRSNGWMNYLVAATCCLAVGVICFIRRQQRHLAVAEDNLSDDRVVIM